MDGAQQGNGNLKRIMHYAAIVVGGGGDGREKAFSSMVAKATFAAKDKIRSGHNHCLLQHPAAILPIQAVILNALFYLQAFKIASKFPSRNKNFLRFVLSKHTNFVDPNSMIVC